MPDEIVLSINRKQPFTQSPIAIVDYFAPNGWVDAAGIVHQRMYGDSQRAIPSVVVVCYAADTQAAYHPAESRAAAWQTKFSQLSQLQNGWNGYDAPAPSAKAILMAQGFVETLLKEKYEPKRVAPSAVGGVAVTQRKHNRKIYVEFFNDGKIFALFSDGSSEPLSKEILPSHQSFKALMKEMQEYLDG
jgi:hypothetical protein